MFKRVRCWQLHIQKCVGRRPCWSWLDKPHGAWVRFPTFYTGSTLQAVQGEKGNQRRGRPPQTRPVNNTGTPSTKAPCKRRHRAHHSDLLSEVYRTEGYPTGVLGWDGRDRKIQLNWIPTVSWPYKPFCSGYLQYPGHTSHFALEPKYHVARTFNSKQMPFTDPAKPESDLMFSIERVWVVSSARTLFSETIDVQASSMLTASYSKVRW